MTDSSSSVGEPDGAGLPADHPLGPASPVPPGEKEGEFAQRAPEGSGGPAPTGREPGADDGAPAADRREEVLDPSAGSAGQPAESIRDEQNTHDAGTVPAAFNGTGTPEDPDEDRRPEDAAAEPDTWDSGGAQR